MAQVEFGIRFPTDRFDQAEVAEEAGFDSMWTGEHIFFYGPTVDAATTMAAWAAKTSRIKIGSAITLLPLRPPAISAKAFSTVDIISQGRTIVGIGVGGEYPPEFQACGVPVNERGARTNEAIEILRQLWSGQEVTHQGRFWQFGPVQLKPLPVQPGGPPIWVSGRSEAAIKRAARLGDGYLPYLFTVERFRRSLEQLDRECAEINRDPAEVVRCVYAFTALGNTYEDARQFAVADLSRRYNQNFEGLAERLCPLGRPEDCATKIQEYIDAGANHVILSPMHGPGEDSVDQVRRFGTEVVPLLRRA